VPEESRMFHGARSSPAAAAASRTIPPRPCKTSLYSEFRRSAKPKQFGLVVIFLGQDMGDIRAQRPDRRIPEDAEADRRADRIVIRHDTPRRCATSEVACLIQAAGIEEDRAADA